MSDQVPRPQRHAAAPRPRHAPPSLRNVALVAAGGAVGALARVALAHRFPVAAGSLPWTTLVENVAGAFALGLVLTLLAERVAADPWVRLLVCTGALGAFTTYSAFATELAGGLLDGHLLLAGAYATVSLAGGLAAAVAGVRAARAWPWTLPLRGRDLRGRRP